MTPRPSGLQAEVGLNSDRVLPATSRAPSDMPGERDGLTGSPSQIAEAIASISGSVQGQWSSAPAATVATGIWRS